MPTIQPMNSSILHRVAAVVGVVAMLLWGVPAGAYADPPDPAPGGAVIDAPTLSLGDLGEGQTLTFDGAADTTSTELSFPVPLGLAPLALNATLQLPVTLRSGNLVVTQNYRTISRIDLPLTDQSPVVVPLAGAEISGNYVTVTLTITAIPLDPDCWDPLRPVRPHRQQHRLRRYRGDTDNAGGLRSAGAAQADDRGAAATVASRVQCGGAAGRGDGDQVRRAEPRCLRDPAPRGRDVAAHSFRAAGTSGDHQRRPQQRAFTAGPGIPSLLVSGQGDELDEPGPSARRRIAALCVEPQGGCRAVAVPAAAGGQHHHPGADRPD